MMSKIMISTRLLLYIFLGRNGRGLLAPGKLYGNGGFELQFQHSDGFYYYTPRIASTRLYNIFPNNDITG